MRKLIYNDNGQGLAEYSLIIGLVSIVVIGSLILFSDELVIVYNNIICEFGGNPANFNCPT